MNIQFGSGLLFGKPVAGNLAANPTPYKFGVLQEVDVQFKGDLKKLYGQKQFAVATARGKLECSIKGKIAVFDVGMLNQLYFAQSAVAVGYDKLSPDEQVVICVTTNTATVAHNPIVDDWGMQDSSGQQYQNTTNVLAIAANQYFVNLTSGVYTVNGAVGTLRISYSYNQNTTGTTITLSNQLMGYAPELKMFLYNSFRNKYLALALNDVTLGTISMPSKLEDFWISDFDGNANADANDTLGKLMADNF
jgi:hypothetical protein